MIDLPDTLKELDAAGVALVPHQQAIDTTTPAGRMFFRSPVHPQSSSEG